MLMKVADKASLSACGHSVCLGTVTEAAGMSETRHRLLFDLQVTTLLAAPVREKGKSGHRRSYLLKYLLNLFLYALLSFGGSFPEMWRTLCSFGMQARGFARCTVTGIHDKEKQKKKEKEKGSQLVSIAEECR